MLGEEGRKGEEMRTRLANDRHGKADKYKFILVCKLPIEFSTGLTILVFIYLLMVYLTAHTV